VQDAWDKIGRDLMAVQSMAILEVVHSLFRLVRSPLFTTVLQVGSRIVILYVYTYWAPECHRHWSLVLMVGSWCLVEVPRYLFYALNLSPQFAGPKMPFPLLWLRYSLFIVLYPTGISGELIQAYIALTTYYTRDSIFERWWLVYLFLAYIPGSPIMIMTMWKNRKSQLRKRAMEDSGAAKRPLDGLVWPITDEEKGERSTSQTNRLLWEQAIAGVDSEAARKISTQKNWRFGYVKHIETQVRAALESEANCLKIAQDGIKSAHGMFEFIRGDKTHPFDEAMAKIKGSYETGFIKGTGKKECKEAVVDYKGERLSGKKLRAQMAAWVELGVCEPSAADAVNAVIDNPEWVDLSDRYFVLLGATSAMGPLDLLLAHGANIIGIDLDRPFIWEKLITKARKSCGTLTFPLSKKQSSIKTDEELFKCSGANLLSHTPEIANWLVDVCPGEPLTVGNYTYLDGALHVQLSIACDAIMEKVCKARPDTAIAFLCTPTDVHNISQEAHDVAETNYKNVPAWQKLAESILGKNDMICNALAPVKKSGLNLMDGISIHQGPNYALAKRIQQWRAVIARGNGHIVSINVAPSTSTKSVTSNPLFAAAYEGFCLFSALEVMEPCTSSSVMLALMINDIRNPKSASNPKTKFSNPMEIFSQNAFHGGAFRCPYKIGSIGTVSVLYFVVKHYGIVLLLILSAMGYVAKYVITGN